MQAPHPQSDALHSRLHCRLRWEAIDPNWVRQLIALAQSEDFEGGGLRESPAITGDVSSQLMAGTQDGMARLVARESMTVCGLRLLPMIAEMAGEAQVNVTCHHQDGDTVTAGTCLAELRGRVQQMLSTERLMLNFLQKLSGVATLTAQYVTALGSSQTRLLDTRKTTPGYRVLEKYATACGGGWNHRLGLFDRVMLKDNHLAASDATLGTALAKLVAQARQTYPQLPVEVEVDALDQIPPVLEAGAHVILLDNFSDDALRQAVARIQGRALTEASGGITLERLPSLAGIGLDFISTGATVHQSGWVDIGMDWYA